MKVSAYYRKAFNALSTIYEQGEAANIASLLITEVTSMSREERLTMGERKLKQVELDLLESYLKRLLTAEPWQYVIGYAYFGELKLMVNNAVLIPRPETEELAELVSGMLNDFSKAVKILDAGTGSGCIALWLKERLGEAAGLVAIDNSEVALEVAKVNAKRLKLNVHFTKADMCKPETYQSLGKFQVIVSNPPYIRKSEEEAMHLNVKDFEPSTALFVPDNDSLCYYKCLIEMSNILLDKNGVLAVEINEAYGKEVRELFEHNNFNDVQVYKDINGRERFVSGRKN
jgi:release factor glutamine methyltransferase